jgi:hypothetical protein
MHALLEKLLLKRKITSVANLTPDEKEQYDRWESVLGEGEMTVDKMRDFCSSQIGVIKGQMKGLDNSQLKNERLIVYLNVYDTMLTLIDSPRAEREALEKYLNQLLTNA